jgi:hypothetical protein
MSKIAALSTLVVAIALSATSVQADGLLGKVLKINGGNDALVNLNVGGSSVLSVKTGGAVKKVVPVEVDVLGKDKLANVSVGVKGVADVKASVGGDGIGACVGLLGSSCGTGGGGTSGGGVTAPGSGGGAGNLLASVGANGCLSPDDEWAISLLTGARYDSRTIASWSKATSVNILSLELCPTVKGKITSAVKGNSDIAKMRLAASQDALISVSLDRNRHSPADILAIERQGSTLVVYVF